ncbi:MAG TPA: transposase [Rubrivivax sp.]|nr:transposase [Rubrivivax sp.]
MARLPRLVLAGHTHCIVQRGHSGQPVFADDRDRASYLEALHASAGSESVQIHAWALLRDEVLLLATPADGPALGRMVQTLGRRYVSGYNRRHGRRGTLWDGRFRCGVVEPGAMRLAALRWIDGQSRDAGVTTAAQRLGDGRMAWLVDPPEIWHLGNTPFEREAAYGLLLAEGLPAAVADVLRRAAVGGWAVGSTSFAADVAQLASRPSRPRPRGRPRSDR